MLEQAVATACFCERKRRELANSSNRWALSTVEAYSKHVFKDDFAFAANLAPEWIDCAQADAIFAVANESIKNMSDADLDEITSAAGRQPFRQSSSRTIAGRYTLWLSGHDQLGPAFSNVLQTTRALIPGVEPTASDLFKDAALYVGEMSVLRNFEAKTAQHLRVPARAPDNLPAATVDAMLLHYEQGQCEKLRHASASA